MKVEDFVTEMASGSGDELNLTTINAYKEMPILKSVCMLYKVSFQSLLEAVEQPSEDISWLSIL